MITARNPSTSGTRPTCDGSVNILYLIAFLNLLALLGILGVWRAMRRGAFDEQALEAKLDQHGLFNRFLGRLLRAITHPWQMYPIGLLSGLGFDTATEIAVLVLAGSGAASGLPWYAILILPVLFAADMSLFDTLDGTFMNFAYHWAFANPVRNVYYNITVTGLSVAVAFIIGTIEIVGLLHDDAGLSNPATDWIAGLNLDNVGFDAAILAQHLQLPVDRGQPDAFTSAAQLGVDLLSTRKRRQVRQRSHGVSDASTPDRPADCTSAHLDDARIWI